MLSVRTYPGATALTLTPWGAHSFASALVRPATPRLARRIARHGDPALEREQRGDEDDLPASARDHVAAELARQDELGREVHLEHVIPQLVGVVRRGHARDRAGVVDEDVDPLVVAAHRLDELVNLGAIPEVAAVGGEAATVRLDGGGDLAALLERGAHTDDVRTGCCERDRRGLADPTPASRDERRPAGEVEGRLRSRAAVDQDLHRGPAREELLEHLGHALERLDSGYQPLEIERTGCQQLDRGVEILRLVHTHAADVELLEEDVEQRHRLRLGEDRNDDDSAAQARIPGGCEYPGGRPGDLEHDVGAGSLALLENSSRHIVRAGVERRRARAPPRAADA